MNVTRHYFNGREEFLAIRKRLNGERRLGGSQIGTVAGENNYCCPRRFYLEFTGAIETPDISGKQSIKDGIKFEDYAAELFCEASGKAVHRENCVMTSEDAPNLFASIDRKINNEESGLECKTANALVYEKFRDGNLPDGYVRQVKTYLKVTGLERWYVSVWIMGITHKIYLFTTIPSEVGSKPEWVDAAYLVTPMELDEVNDIAKGFFEKYVDAGVAPEYDGSEDAGELLKETCAKEDPAVEPVKLTSVTKDDLKRIGELNAEIDRFETEIEAIKQKIKNEMQAASEASVDGVKITWKTNKDSSVTDWKSVAQIANVDAAVINSCTKVKPGARMLRIGKVKAA